jgi:hypothetical protein
MNEFEYSILFKFNFCNRTLVTEISMFYAILLRIPSFCPLIQIKDCAN